MPRLLPLDGDQPRRADGTGTEQSNLVAEANPADVRAVLARGGDNEGGSVWIRTVTRPQDQTAQPDYRWRYPALEDLLARPSARRPKLHRYLADKDPIVATNAAIALGRGGDDAGAERLAGTVRNPTLNLPMRCAAIEALAALREASAARLLRELLDQYGPGRPEQGSAYRATLHAELIRGLARRVDATDQPSLIEALGSRSAEVRLEAMRAWSGGRGGALPTEVVRRCEDADPRVRRAALLAVARYRHADGHAILDAGLRDHDIQVRTAAIAALGELGGAKAQATLARVLKDPNERIRGAAVSALAGLGAARAVMGAADDEKWRVRLEVARALSQFPGRDGATAARALLADSSAEVQRETVRALAEWPPPQAGPILLEAMASRSLVARETAADQLASWWSPATEFQSQGPPRRRAEVLDDLRGRFRRQFGLVDRAALDGAASESRPTTRLTPQQLAYAEQLVREQNIRALVGFGPGVVEALEQLAVDRQQVLPETVYREVLPEHDPIFGALRGLASAELSERRRAAGELAELTALRPLGRLAVARLQQLVTAEPDQAVWRDVLTALSANGSEPAIRLAYAAISHPVPEVRRRACVYLAAHPHPEHADVLVPALEDRNHSVVVAAARALGRAGRIDDTAPLRRLLATTNEELRLEAAVALARLGDPEGAAELERLAYSADPNTCRGVAQAMGEIADPAFVPTLIRLLDARVSVVRAALESLPKVVGNDRSLGDEMSPPPTPERVRRWKQWYQRSDGYTKGG